MTTKEQVIVWSEQTDDYADKKLQCEGEYHPDWHEVRDAYFATLVRNAALEEAAQKCEALAVTDCHDSNTTRHECAQAIRAMKEPTT